MPKAPHLQIRYYRLLLKEPKLTAKEAAERLGVSEDAVLWTRKRIRERRDPIWRYCPECLTPTLKDEGDSEVCSRCGVQFDKPSREVRRIFWGDDHSPAHNLHPDQGLGSHVDMKELKRSKIILNQPRFLSEKKSPRERFVEECVSELWSLLKGCGYDEATTDEWAKKIRAIAKRYSRKTLGREAVVDVLALFLLEASATTKDYRLAEMAKWLNGLKGRQMPKELELNLRINPWTGKIEAK